MIKSHVKEIVDRCFTEGVKQGYWSEAAGGRYTVEVPKREGQGDFSTNFALVAAGIDKRKPRDLAAQFAELLGGQSMIERVEVAGPGFINLFLDKKIWVTVLAPIYEQDAHFGRSTNGADRRVLVEFVSANPTGPLSVGHGRNAVLGDTIARLLTASGYAVQREYYFNDAGRQMRVLGESTRARYLELLGLANTFPEDGYQGDYIYDIARAMIDEAGDGFKDAELAVFKERAQRAIFADIDATLKRIGIGFDTYFNEHTLYEDGRVNQVVEELRAKNLVYEKEGATWFKTTEFGQEQDRVIIKSSGEPTYRLPDIAYHCDKFKRGYDWMINVFGSDHIATVPDVLAGVRALGHDDSRITVVLYQFVTLLRDGKQVKMSTRKATFVTVDELVDEVGPDALRFFFLMRKPDNLIEFDLDLAKKQSQENPVYYVQYAHARLCSIERQAREQGVNVGTPDQILARLAEPEEYGLLKTLAEYPQLVAGAAADLAPHRVVFYLMDLAGQFHGFYNKHKVLGDDPELSRARLYLCGALKRVFRNGLTLIGLRAPETM
ncbi:arginyl-tRNA synthetase [Desulfobulbus propionicus DSM 2032]|uniref:Arginine--tRNA ligase n=1 Tax=Desulfobulbus propionicus (strain ATCC 33891 / DSM 2032 / VKM B-1956 / 1pr3) TaxID=577650 RepID=A0A7U3YMF8_DESPD|nr:arginine--tRNA ligase [Desulfobulbus propionicus]ADW18092.1 arginyl-tRNA synthetase [Desulfobulbus propionicus DSM 2032]